MIFVYGECESMLTQINPQDPQVRLPRNSLYTHKQTTSPKKEFISPSYYQNSYYRLSKAQLPTLTVFL